MKHLIVGLFCAASFGVACLSVGCQANSDLPSNERANTSGGNGAFGENPVRPGRYATSDTLNTDAPAATTQPSGNMGQ
jgi:hypothetical protein